MGEKNTEIINVDMPEVVDDTDDLVMTFAKPFTFEGKTYELLDLSPLEDITGNDLVMVSRQMSRSSAGINAMPEFSLDFAIYIAARALKLPLEFFYALPAKEVIKTKNRVMGFLFG